MSMTLPALGAKKAALNFNQITLNFDAPLSGHLMWLKNKDLAQHLVIEDKRFDSKRFVLFRNIKSTAKNPEYISIPDKAVAYSTARLANSPEDVIVYLTDNGVTSYNITTDSYQTLLQGHSIFSSEQVLSPSHKITFAEDLNKDGLTDFILADFNQSHVYIQNQDGLFSHYPLALKPHTELFRQSRTFTQQNHKLLDINDDGLVDICYQKEDNLLAHLQTPEGGFAHTAQTISLNADIVSEKTLDAKKREKEGKTKLKYAKFVELTDINNDNITDLVTKRTQREGIFKNEGQLEIRYGKMKKSLLSFTKQPNTSIPYDGQLMAFGKTLNNYQFLDLNADGYKDIFFPRKDFGFGDIISGLISRSTDVDIEFFLMNKTQQFNEEPAQEKEVELAFDLDSESASIPLFSLNDFNGDGLNDLLIQTDEKRTRLYLGNIKGPFSKRGKKYKMPLPRNGNLIEVIDINHDGLADIVFRYDHTDGTDKSKQITLWLSKKA